MRDELLERAGQTIVKAGPYAGLSLRDIAIGHGPEDPGRWLAWAARNLGGPREEEGNGAAILLEHIPILTARSQETP